MKTLTIIDGYGFLFRAYYVLPELKTSTGVHINGLYGFINILMKQVRRILIEPDPYIVIVFDSGKPNFRHELFSKYKANRPDLDENLIGQFPMIREAATAFGIRSEESSNFEADDLIATIANKLNSITDLKITVVTTDKDLLQLLEKGVSIFDPVKDMYLDNDYAITKFGVNANMISDILALAGDPSDNIPGVKGVGIKTAAKLITEFGSIEDIINNLDDVTPTRIKENIKAQKDELLLFKKLTMLHTNADINVSLDLYKFPRPDARILKFFLGKYECDSLYKKVFSTLDISTSVDSQPMTESYSSDTDITRFLANGKTIGKLAILEYENKLSIAYSKTDFIYINRTQFREFLQFLNDSSIIKIICGQNLEELSSQMEEVEDVLVLNYSARTQRNIPTIESLCSNFLHEIPNQINASTLIQIYEELKQLIAKERLFVVYELIDRQIIPILKKMELTRIYINTSTLVELAKKFNEDATKIKKEIYEFVGYEFNIGSPEQVSKALEKYIDSNEKKTKSGFFSTGSQLLEKLSSNGLFPAAQILLWRHLTKLINTYTTPLINFAKHGYITTTYSIFTATGRLSSSNYNIHNLPIKTSEGKNIRKAFIPRAGNVLISADYSQIELRIIAHICKAKAFIDAFMNSRDIHYDTAAALFGIPKNMDDIEDLRRKAKAINFGILYGISPFGLSQQLGISQHEAKAYIEQYFKIYPEILEYMEKTVSLCKETKFVKTIFGRKCIIADISNSNAITRKHAERQAINAPIQGSASDILKLVLIQLSENLPEHTKILFQVHDEIVFETPESNFKEVAIQIKNIMESIVKLNIPLIADINVGYNWLESFWRI